MGADRIDLLDRRGASSSCGISHMAGNLEQPLKTNRPAFDIHEDAWYPEPCGRGEVRREITCTFDDCCLPQQLRMHYVAHMAMRSTHPDVRLEPGDFTPCDDERRPGRLARSVVLWRQRFQHHPRTKSPALGGTGFGIPGVVETGGFEPPTSAMRMLRSPI